MALEFSVLRTNKERFHVIRFGSFLLRRVVLHNLLSAKQKLQPVAELAKYKAIIISGGPQSVYGAAAPKYDPELFNINKPILGLCYGMQLMNFVHGGKVEKKATREDGVFAISIDRSSPLFAGFDEDKTEVLLTHGDSVTELGKGFKLTATSPSNIASAIEHPEKQIYGVQFHPEVGFLGVGEPLGIALFDNRVEQPSNHKKAYNIKWKNKKCKPFSFIHLLSSFVRLPLNLSLSLALFARARVV